MHIGLLWLPKKAMPILPPTELKCNGRKSGVDRSTHMARKTPHMEKWTRLMVQCLEEHVMFQAIDQVLSHGFLQHVKSVTTTRWHFIGTTTTTDAVQDAGR